MSKKFLVPFKLLTRASDPSSGHEGEVYFNTTDSSIRVHNGIVWVTIMKSTDPVPFYMHTHNYDGEVDSVFPIPLTVDNLGDNGILSIDGGIESSSPTTDPNPSNTIDGGIV